MKLINYVIIKYYLWEFILLLQEKKEKKFIYEWIRIFIPIIPINNEQRRFSTSRSIKWKMLKIDRWFAIKRMFDAFLNFVRSMDCK